MENEWNEAASLLVVSKCEKETKSGQDFDLLMTKRSGKSSFFASAYVFPGGHLEMNDFSNDWWKLFDFCGYNKDTVRQCINRIEGSRPEIITENRLMKRINKECLPADIALRICAIRETFEETNVLIVKPNLIETQDLQEWRKKIHENSENFIKMCFEKKCVPNIWEIYEWWNWLTPSALSHKRFDTIFYIHLIENKPIAISDNKEVTEIEWCSAQHMLDEHEENRAFLAPPQVYELSRLLSFSSFNSLLNFAVSREKFGIERWLPIIIGYADGAALALPGDDKYGDESESMSSMPTLEEARRQVDCYNRIELRAPFCHAFCNTKVACKHVSPVTYPPQMIRLVSKLS